LQLTVLTDRSQGGTSPRDGVIELMVHRRLLHDDAKGVGEALNETGVDGRGLVIRGRHLLQLAPIDQAARQHRPRAQEMFMAPVVGFSRYTGSQSPVAPFEHSNLHNPLPPNIHLLTLEEWSHGRYLLR